MIPGEELSPAQLRRLRGGMTDPADEGQVVVSIRRAHLRTLLNMIERRERAMMDFVLAVETLSEGDIHDCDSLEKIHALCVKFWTTSDKWAG